MRFAVPALASFYFLAEIASAHPLIIVHTHITSIVAPGPVPTHHYVGRQNLFDDIASAANSLLGLDPETTSSTKKTTAKSTSSVSVRTVVPPAVVAATTSSAEQRTSTSTQSEDDSDDQTSTSSDESPTSETSTADSSSSTSSEISTTSSASTTVAPATSPTISSAPATATPESSDSSNSNNGVPPGGIAVAAIMVILVLLVSAWLVFKYHPKCQAWYAAREEKKFQARSYRDAIDGPGSGLRSQALGGGMSRRQTILKSFFAPATVKLGDGKEIRRKPVNWGAGSSNSTPNLRAESPPPLPVSIDMEKIPVDATERIPMTAAAAPMGQIERYSYMLQPQSKPKDESPAPPVPAKIPAVPSKTPVSAVSPLSMRVNEDLERLPPISPLSHRSIVDRKLPVLPPVPALPSLIHAKRGSDGVFRLS